MANGSENSGGRVLVLGSNGKTGSRIVERLRPAGNEVRLGSRSATPPFDWNDQTTWPAVLDGIGAAYVAYQPAVGREIEFQTVPMDVYRQALLDAQLPREIVDLIVYLFTTVLDGRNTPLTDGVQRALGRRPKKFSDYVERTVASGVWGSN
jgi:uncharacterized protein YbjT (DUF2867 family)